MKKELQNKILKAKEEICDSIQHYLENKDNQTVNFENETCYLYLTGSIVYRQFIRMFLEKNTVMVEYLTGEGFEPSGFKRITEALTALEMSEICEIVKFIKE